MNIFLRETIKTYTIISVTVNTGAIFYQGLHFKLDYCDDYANDDEET